MKKGAYIPYILDLLPHLELNDMAPMEALKLAMQRWPYERKPHIVADAAFGSIEMLEKITTWGGSATLSCPQTVMPWIWELLSIINNNLPPSHWRAAKLQSSNIIASLLAGTDHYGKLLINRYFLLVGQPKQQVSITGVISEMPRFESYYSFINEKR